MRYILISAVAAWAIERHHLVIEVGDRDALRAGVIEIRGVDSHAGAGLAVLAESHAGSHGDIFERAVALIAVELIRLRVVGDQQVRPAVVIVIEHRHAQRFRGAVEDAALRRDVFKGAVAAIAKQPAGFPRYASGVQYDLCLPSTLQKTSCSGDHFT